MIILSNQIKKVVISQFGPQDIEFKKYNLLVLLASTSLHMVKKSHQVSKYEINIIIKKIIISFWHIAAYSNIA